MNFLASRRNQVIIGVILLSFLILGIALRAQADNPKSVILDVPYVPQVSDGKWVSPWDEACEEASITMIDGFYNGEERIAIADAKNNMEAMFLWENEAFGLKDDTTAEQTKQLIETHSNFDATIKRNPSIEDIREELRDRRPVIAFVNMYELYQEKNLGDSFHVFVIIGYDDTKQEFIIHDPARSAQRYSYDVLMKSLHDFNPATKEANGEPTVIFTTTRLQSSSNLIEWFLNFFRR